MTRPPSCLRLLLIPPALALFVIGAIAWLIVGEDADMIAADHVAGLDDEAAGIVAELNQMVAEAEA